MSPYIIPGSPCITEEDVFSFRVQNMVSLICNYCGVCVEALPEETKKGEIVRARHLCFYFMKKYTKMSQKSIGQYFGGRDHTTVGNALRKIDDYIDVKDDFTVKALVEVDDLLGKFNLNNSESFKRKK